MEIKDSTILVTGGAGNIGSHIIDMLIEEGAKKIIVLDNLTRGRTQNLKWAQAHGNIELVNGDICDKELVNKLCKEADYVYHEAAIRITQCAQEPELANKILVDGTYTVFEACAKNDVKKLIFASSASVYGDPSYLPMDEAHPYNNKTIYGVGKIYAEHLAKSFRNMFGLNYIGFRYFNVYGPRMDIFGVYTEVMIKWLDRIDQGIQPLIFGDGKQSMDFVYVRDVAKANILALKSDINEGVYNVGTGVETDLNELCQKMLEVTNATNLKPEYKIPEKLVIVSRRRACTKKAEKDLGFKAEVSLERGLKELLKWREEEKNDN